MPISRTLLRVVLGARVEQDFGCDATGGHSASQDLRGSRPSLPARTFPGRARWLNPGYRLRAVSRPVDGGQDGGGVLTGAPSPSAVGRGTARGWSRGWSRG